MAIEVTRSTVTPSHPQHIPGLDGVRGLAILLVLFFHTNGQIIFRLNRNHDGDALSRLVSWMADQGSRGVDLFFVLSGFSNNWHFVIEPRIADWKVFFEFLYATLVANFFRSTLVLSLSLLSSFQCLEIQYTTSGMADAQTNQMWLWFYGSNIGMARYSLVFGRFSHFWTLAIEEHFYLVWPAIVWFCGASKLTLACLTVIVTAILCRIAFVIFGDLSSAHLLTPCRADALALGGLLASVLNQYNLNSLRSIPLLRIAQWGFGIALAVSMFCLTVGSSNAFTNSVLLPSVVSVLSASLIALVLPSLRCGTVSVASKLMNSLLLRKFGKYSYAIYLFHVPLIPLIYVLFAKLSSLIRLPLESLPFVVVTLSYFLITAGNMFSRFLVELGNL